MSLPAKGKRRKNAGRLWVPKPSDMQYERVPIAPYSFEFTEVEKQLRKSIKWSAVITSIERVQKPIVWENYQRYTVKFKVELWSIVLR